MQQDTTTNINIKELLATKKPLFMGILNITPDSFSDGGKYFNLEDATKHAKELIDKGVDIIDIGGESTRPGATPITEEEELGRVIPVVEEIKHVSRAAINRGSTVLISIDTYKANVAQLALNAGAQMINDVSGLTMDSKMVHVAAKANCPIVIMHNNGIPATKPMSREDCRGRSVTCPADVLQDIFHWLQKQSQYAINHGIKKENIIIDPGIGFGKTAEEDLLLIQNLKEFKSLGFPILIGPSKKSFIRKLFRENDFEEKNNELIKLSIENGAAIVRVH